MDSMPDPPSTEDTRLAITRLNWMRENTNNPAEAEALSRVVTFWEHMAPMMDIAQKALASGSMPNLATLSDMLQGMDQSTP